MIDGRRDFEPYELEILCCSVPTPISEYVEEECEPPFAEGLDKNDDESCHSGCKVSHSVEETTDNGDADEDT